VKSLDRTTNLRPKELLVHLPGNVNEFYLQTVLLKAQHVQILISRTTPFSVGSKKEAGLEEISSRTAA